MTLKHFFTCSKPEQIKDFLGEIFECINSRSELEELYELICSCEMTDEVTKAVISITEWICLSKKIPFLLRYIYQLYCQIDDKPMQNYYFELLNKRNDISEDEAKRVFEQNNLHLSSDAVFSKYNSEAISYTYLGEEKQYGIYSFSYEIGLNMTLIKTPYGAVICDCGAKAGDFGVTTISADEIKSFLGAFDLTPDDVVAVVISHAHLDHYGSINSLVKAGIDKSRIYVEDATRYLIATVSSDDYLINDYSSVNSFYYPNKKVEIIPFSNGHILGSVGYVIHFDNRNIVYTGDFCVHDQPIVEGLKVERLISLPCIKEDGVSCLITETTYGSKNSVLTSEQAAKVIRHFVDIAVSNNYKVFVPGFAVGRSQEIASALKGYDILIDGLAIAVTRVYEKMNEKIRIFDSTTDFASQETEDKLRNFDLHDVIIASSGMISENSTSYNYINEFLKSYKNVCIIKSGYISSEAVGNTILKKWQNEDNIMLDIPLSAHASRNEIIELINNLDPDNVVMIHGDGIGFYETEQ